ncbi:MAG: integral rane sensor signal transduction histidine kinase, partial [Verrucomicrobiales bacterium]|nr:integral rane sensor signal transduction histidine kinase [Verrucomicrobiales bacterium]
MSFPVERKRTVLPTFRVKLLLAMMMIVSVITIVAIYAAQRHLAAEAASSLQREFQEKLSALHSVQQARRAGVTERCRALVRRPRIHAALEDNALDLLYPSARDELRDVLEEVDNFPDEASLARHAEFYRFLDIKGALLSPADGNEIGRLSREEESLLALKSVSQSPQAGYLHRKHNGRKEDSVSEILAVPIMSSETGEPIAALVLGFKPLGIVAGQVDEGVKSGILFD